MVVQNSILRRPMQSFMIFLMKVTEDAVSLLFTWLIKADHFSPKVGQIYIEGITWPRAALEDTNFIFEC